MLCSQGLPEDGRFIVGTNDQGGCWVEKFDIEEPLGWMVAWHYISEQEYEEAKFAGTREYTRLFIVKSVSLE